MSMTQPTAPNQHDGQGGLLQRIGRQIACFLGLADPTDRLDASHRCSTREDKEAPRLQIVTVKEEPQVVEHAASFRWRRHPLLLAQSPELAPSEREARHEAVRGLFAARAGALDCAVDHFSVAARCEEIDLSAIPGFWQLDRAAMITAVDAYERAGRIRDASALNARIRTMYRPRALSAVPANVTALPVPSTRATSNS